MIYIMSTFVLVCSQTRFLDTECCKIDCGWRFICYDENLCIVCAGHGPGGGLHQ